MANSGYPSANADLGYQATSKKTSSSGGKQYGGWYDNPETGRNQRWWNGVWTDGEEPNGLLQKSDEMAESELANLLIELDNNISNIAGMSLSDAEKDMYLQKAMEQVKPYYEKKRAEIEAGIKEGKIRTAEDLLMEMRQVSEVVTNEIANLDASKAQTEEEFVNTLAEMTRSKDVDAEANRISWMERVDSARKEANQAGYSSDTGGFGLDSYNRQKRLAELSQSNIEGEFAAKKTAMETEKKYDLERIALARKAQEQKRMRIVGSPTEEAATKTALASTAGLDENNLISEIEMQRRRAERGISPVYNSGALNDLTEQEKIAIESRKLALQDDELAARKQTAYAQKSREKTDELKKYKTLTGSANYLS